MGTTATSTTYRLAPLDSDSAAALRDLGGLTYVADEKPGYPCRHCLRDAEIGEALVLVSRDPFDPEVDTLYRSASPIFLHAEPCNARAISQIFQNSSPSGSCPFEPSTAAA